MIKIDEIAIEDYLDKVVYSTVEEALNQLLDVEADRKCNAEKYQSTEASRDTRVDNE